MEEKAFIQFRLEKRHVRACFVRKTSLLDWTCSLVKARGGSPAGALAPSQTVCARELFSSSRAGTGSFKETGRDNCPPCHVRTMTRRCPLTPSIRHCWLLGPNVFVHTGNTWCTVQTVPSPSVLKLQWCHRGAQVLIKTTQTTAFQNLSLTFDDLPRPRMIITITLS